MEKCKLKRCQTVEGQTLPSNNNHLMIFILIAMSNSAFKFQREFLRNLGYCTGGGGTFNIQVCSETNNNEEVEFIHKKITGHSQ